MPSAVPSPLAEKHYPMDRLSTGVRAYKLAEIRREQALTQRDVAATMGISAPRVSVIEHGETGRTEVATLAPAPRPSVGDCAWSPGRGVLVGNEVAFVAHQASDEDIPSIIAVYEPMTILPLHRLYDFAWQAGMDFDADVVSYGETLTDLNAGIINLMAQGLKDEVVARRIGVGSRTFRRHISNIMDKLGASSRFQAGAVAARAGLIDGRPIRGPAQTP